MSTKEIQWNFIPEVDLTYLKQPQEAYQVTHSEYYIYHTDGKNHYRRIFYRVEFSEFEKKCMLELQDAIEKENIELPADWDDAQTLKYCYSGGFDLKYSIECLKMHLNWKMDPKMQRLNSHAEEILIDILHKCLRSLNLTYVLFWKKSGVFYHLGRDIQYRPIIVLNIWKVNPKTTPLDVYLSAICNLLVKVAEVEFIRGHVESWLVILDTNEKGITDLDINSITKIVQIMAKNFTSTLEKMFIVNPSFLFNGIWSIIKKFVHPETAAKIHMLKKKEFHTIQKFVAADQLEEKYGGTIPNRTVYWPPLNTNKQIPGVDIQDEDQELFSSINSYKTIDNNSVVITNRNQLTEITDIHQANPLSQPIPIGYSGHSNTGSGGCCSRCTIY